MFCHVLNYNSITGVGLGLLYLPTILVVNFYFHKKRALATGIAVCGAGVGTFVFAPLGEALLEMYGWKGSTWILAGLMLNCVMFSTLYRPMDSGHLSTDESEIVPGVEQDTTPQNCIDDVNAELLNIGDKENDCKISLQRLELEKQTCDGIQETASKETKHVKNELTGCTTNEKSKMCLLNEPITQSNSSSGYVIDNIVPVSFSLHMLGATASAISISRSVCAVNRSDGSFKLIQILKSMKSEMCNSEVMRNPAIITFGIARFFYSLGEY